MLYIWLHVKIMQICKTGGNQAEGKYAKTSNKYAQLFQEKSVHRENCTNRTEITETK